MKNNRFIVKLLTILMFGAFILPVSAEDQSNDLTDEQRADHREFRKEMREKTKDMTPEEKKQYRNKRISEKMEKMTPEERERFKAHRANR